MPPLTKIAFVLDEFSVSSPAQQLLDRFLLGYPHDGEFIKPVGRQTAATVRTPSQDALRSRVEQHGLIVGDWKETIAGAHAVVVVPTAEPSDGQSVRPSAPAGTGVATNDDLVSAALEAAQPNSIFFVYGALATTLARARQHLALARQRSISILAGTPLAVTWRLPERDLPLATRITDALIVVPEPSPAAVINGLEGLLPIIERRHGGETGVRRLDYFHGKDVWRVIDKTLSALLAAAISRSHSPLGDPVRDGRTQDLVGLGLLPKLAAVPQAWRLEHRDGLRTTILSLHGALADINVAVRQRDGGIYSAQLFRPPPPAHHSFSRLAGVLTDFFRGGSFPWPVERNLLQTSLWETCRELTARSATGIKNRDWKIAYQ